MKKRIVCLANSRKPGGYCVAGIDLDTSEWVRPIGDNDIISQHDECLNFECDNNTMCKFISPKKLDILDIRFKQKLPKLHQIENHIIDNYWWEKVDQLEPSRLDSYLDNPETIWHNGSSSSYGYNDRVIDELTCNNSLLLIKPQSFSIHVIDEGYNEEKKCLRGQFQYNNIYYRLRITDKDYEQKYCNYDYGKYSKDPDNYRLCISLAIKSFHGHYYKLIAGIHKIS